MGRGCCLYNLYAFFVFVYVAEREGNSLGSARSFADSGREGGRALCAMDKMGWEDAGVGFVVVLIGVRVTYVSGPLLFCVART